MLFEKDETASTNDDARELALAGAASGTAVLARRQSKGRGRAGRSFVSPEGGLYLSVVLRLRRPPSEWGLLPLLAGVVVARVLRERGFAASLKWPNDVLVEDKKVGGILVESSWGASPFAVVGIGVNLERAPVGDATALAMHGRAPDRVELARALVARLVARAEEWEASGRASVLADVRASCATLGREVVWDEGEGRAVDVAEDGALVVESVGGARRVLAGDVRVRPRAP